MKNFCAFTATIIALVSLTTATRSLAQWQTTCQPGAVFSVAVNGAELFVNNSRESIWLSPDSGNTWTTVLGDNEVGSVLMAALFVNNGVVYVGTSGSGIYRSTDNGKDWASADSGIPAPSSEYISTFYALGDTVFVATQSAGVFRSVNAGLTWTEADSGLPNTTLDEVTSFTSIGSDLYASDNSGIYESKDYGAHWFNIYGGVGAGVVVLSSCGQNLLASMQYGETVPPYSISWFLMVSTDGGSSWNADSTGGTSFPPGIEITSFASSGDEVFAETVENGLYRSTDDGIDWSASSNGIFGDTPVYGGPAFQGMTVFAAYGQNLFKSENNGDNWELIDNGMPADTSTGQSLTLMDFQESVLSLAAKGPLLFAGTGGEGVYASTDRGITWSAANYGLPYESYINTITLVNDSDLVAGVSGTFVPGTIYRSTDDGASWTDVNNGISVNTGINGLASVGSNVFAAASSGGYLSTDGGVNWTLMSGNGGFPARTTVNFTFAQGSTFFAGGSGTGILLSTNGGTQWTVADSGVPSNVTVSAFGGNGSNVFAATSVGLYESRDGGLTWAVSDSGLPADISLNTCTVSGNAGATILAAPTQSNGEDYSEYLSTDGGSSWNPIDDGMIPATVACSLVDSNRIFLGITYGGAAGGSQWGVWYWSLKPLTSVRGSGLAARPTNFQLDQNYPNPFNPTTVISYKLSAVSNVTLKVYDILGREVARLVNEKQSAGNYSVTFDGSRLASGVYFYRLAAGDFVSVKKLVLLK